MPDLSSQFEKKLQQQILDYATNIKAIYYRSITEISFYAAALKEFNPDNSPALRQRIEKIISEMHGSIQAAITNSIVQAWGLSNDKNDQINAGIIGDRDLIKAAKNLIYNPNAGALIEFTKRKEGGMNLSDRVWNLVEPYQFELEAGLTDGIAKGKSAASMATSIKQFLQDPDKLFRRVRDKNGVLQLSKAAKAYHPGQGIARSSYKNALRLTATETNMSYRSSDFERWNNEVFVRGIKIETSNNHPTFDECDNLAGIYPKEYLFRGFHPRCLCHATPILISDEEFNKLEDKQLGLSEDAPDIDYITDIPERAKNWIRDNAERINGWKSTPYWVKDNPQFVNNSLGRKGKKSPKIKKLAKVKEENSGPSNALKSIEDKIRDQKFESAAVIKSGKQIFFKDGEKSRVSFTDQEAALMAGAILTHNHPGGRSFSQADVQFFAKFKVEEIRAVSTFADYSLKQTELTPLLTRQIIKQLYEQFNNEIYNEFLDKMAAGEMTESEANQQHHHRILLLLSKELNLDYNRVLR